MDKTLVFQAFATELLSVLPTIHIIYIYTKFGVLSKSSVYEFWFGIYEKIGIVLSVCLLESLNQIIIYIAKRKPRNHVVVEVIY